MTDVFRETMAQSRTTAVPLSHLSLDLLEDSSALPSTYSSEVTTDAYT